MYTYRAGSAFQGIFFLESIISSVFISFGGLLAFNGMYLLSFIFSIIGILGVYILLFLFPTEISVKKTGIMYKTVIRNSEVSFSDIRSIKKFYTTRPAFALSDIEKQKASMICMIILKDNPMNILMFGKTICKYKELYSRIMSSVEDIKVRQSRDSAE